MIGIILKAISKGFRCDPEKSSALAEIRTIHTPEGDVYHFNVSVEIEPYPNPLTYGGYFQNIGTQKPEERDAHLAYLQQEFELYRQIGMENIEIRNESDYTQQTQLKLI